jgi:hypothetical protein
MTGQFYKKYTRQAKAGIKGESFFESLISDYSIPHKISGAKDVGLDFICEWVFEDKPSGVLFGVQIKTLSDKRTRPKPFGISALNGLEQYKIGSSKLRVDESTLTYWKAFGLPIYLFAILLEGKGEEEMLNCYYKRFTPILTERSSQDKEYFYKVNSGRNIFLAFKSSGKKSDGFTRDLFIDYTRWNYFKGSITYLNPRILGLQEFPEEGVFVDLFAEYYQKIISTYNRTTQYLQLLHSKSKET